MWRCLEIDPRRVQNFSDALWQAQLACSLLFLRKSFRSPEAKVNLRWMWSGARPIDLHFKPFEAMGAKVSYEGDNGEFICPKGHGASIYMDTVSAGAAINTHDWPRLKQRSNCHWKMRPVNQKSSMWLPLNNMGLYSWGGLILSLLMVLRNFHGTRHQVIPDRIGWNLYFTSAAAVAKKESV